MELYPENFGGDLKVITKRNFLHHVEESCRPLSWGERVKIAVGVFRGLKYLHDNNIIHGSIKPSNILLNHDFEPMVILIAWKPSYILSV